mgnify:CR=1 FL=1
MSVCRECRLYLTNDGQWYMDLANEEYGGYDDCTTYGPFYSEDATLKYLDDNFSNPGGFSVDSSGIAPAPTMSPNGSKVISPSRSRWRY